LRGDLIRYPLLGDKKLARKLVDELYSISMSVEEILSEASKLSEEERASIASQLIHSLPATHYSVSDDDVALRVQEAEANEDVLIPFEEFVEGIKRGEN